MTKVCFTSNNSCDVYYVINAGYFVLKPSSLSGGMVRYCVIYYACNANYSYCIEKSISYVFALCVFYAIVKDAYVRISLEGKVHGVCINFNRATT